MDRRQFSGLLLVAMVTVGGLSACARVTSGGPGTETTSPAGEGAILNGSPSPEPGGGESSPPGGGGTGEPSPPGGGDGGATPPPGGGGSANSTLASKAGFVWGYDTDSTYTAVGNYRYNSAGGAINITHIATGRYLVSFVGLGDPGGIAHAQAYGSTPNYCNVDLWIRVGGNENVYVSCYNPAGTLTNTRFVANWAAGSEGTAQFGYLWANEASNPGPYHPSSTYRYDALSTADMTVRRLSAGRYEVHLPVSALDEPAAPWTYQITAYASKNRCKLHSVNLGAGNAVVACRNTAGFNVDTRFSITYGAYGSMIGRLDRHNDDSGQSVSGVPSNFGGTINHPATGIYEATLGDIGGGLGHAVALGTGTSSIYCHVRNWQDIGSNLKVGVVCYTLGGSPANSGFTVSASQ